MRISRDTLYMRMAFLVSERTTCPRRRVGCVLVDMNNKVLSIGYNGVPRGFAHCVDHPCAGAHMPSGTGLELCEATHAEQNALLGCDAQQVYTCYVTASPCVHCVKMLLNTPCGRIVFAEEYPHTEARRLWVKNSSLHVNHHAWDHWAP